MGKRFFQYQFIIPIEKSYDALFKILQKYLNLVRDLFLQSLSFMVKRMKIIYHSLEGYSLALDFKIEDGIFDLLDDLDEVILEYKGESIFLKILEFQKVFLNLDILELVSLDN